MTGSHDQAMAALCGAVALLAGLAAGLGVLMRRPSKGTVHGDVGRCRTAPERGGGDATVTMRARVATS
jgi:hypothetical protein